MMLLPLVHLTLNIQQQQDLRLPEHAGSMLRGAFGMALKKLACITRQKECQSCPLYRSCAYTQIFETPAQISDNPLIRQTANPYVIQAPIMGARLVKAGEQWQFGLTVIGKAIDQLPLIVYAWQKACEVGFTKAQSTAKLVSIYQQDHLAYLPNGQLTIKQTELPTKNYSQQATLQFISPLRLQHEGKIATSIEQFTAPLLLMTMARRTQKLLDLHTQAPVKLNFLALKEQAQAITLETVNLHYQRITRYSNRQQQFIELDGVMGDIVLKGDLGDFAPLLTVGEYIHVGKTATHGLGRYLLAG